MLTLNMTIQEHMASENHIIKTQQKHSRLDKSREQTPRPCAHKELDNRTHPRKQNQQPCAHSNRPNMEHEYPDPNTELKPGQGKTSEDVYY